MFKKPKNIFKKDYMYNDLVDSEDTEVHLVDKIIANSQRNISTKERLESLNDKERDQLIAKIKGFESSYNNVAIPLSLLSIIFVIVGLVLEPMGLNDFTLIYYAVLASVLGILYILLKNQANVVKEAVIVRSILEDIKHEKDN